LDGQVFVIFFDQISASWMPYWVKGFGDYLGIPQDSKQKDSKQNGG
jgi:hypothetical protein